MIKTHQDQKPVIHETCFIAETAVVIGNVVVKERSSLWYNVVVRGDYHSIAIGKNTNIQDGSVVHIADHHPTIIGDYVTVGHGAIIHGCTIGNQVLVGMGAILLNGAVIGDNTMIAAGSLVPEGKAIPSGVLAMGSPAKVVRDLTKAEMDQIKCTAEDYVGFAQNFINGIKEAEWRKEL